MKKHLPESKSRQKVKIDRNFYFLSSLSARKNLISRTTISQYYTESSLHIIKYTANMQGPVTV